MLARHLLFIATRRHNNTILAIDSVPPHGLVQPPLYISPPMPEECQKEKIQEIVKDTIAPQKIQTQCDKQHYGHQAVSAPKIYAQDPRQNLYGNNRLLDQNKVSSCNDYLRACNQRQVVHMRNARNLQYYAPAKNVSQQFYTLPSRRPQRDVEPPRSVTPDITRGLGRGSLSTMHVLARHGQRAMVEHDCNQYSSQVELGRSSESFGTESRFMPNQQQQPTVDIRNRFATPFGLTALGYRFFASSPVRDPVTKSPSADALKHNPISPIRHGYSNSFKSSTPPGRSAPTVAERLALTGSNNCPSPMPNSGRSTPTQDSSGRSTPTNLILSPTKSTMSNEELFAAIHKSKKRLNIKDDNENVSPYGPANLLVNVAPRSRQNFSTDPQKSMVTQNMQSPSPATSRLDFKRLLLQQSVKTGPARLSAAEQLKLSRQQCQQQQSPNVQQTTPLAKVLSPRSVWRFQTPRTDVLSSTIIEDTAAEEKAMKPSPENASPVSRLNVRRQLDLCSNLPEDQRDLDSGSNTSNTCNDRLLPSKVEPSDRKVQEDPRQNSTLVNNNCLTSPCVSNAPTAVTRVSDWHSQNKTISHQSQNCSQLTPSCQQAISAFESRRISNQLARAQFLTGTPTSVNQGQNVYAKNVFRGRSESPQNPATQSVSRTPSVPTLETAL